MKEFREAANASAEEIGRVRGEALKLGQAVTLQTYTLELIGPPGEPPWAWGPQSLFDLKTEEMLRASEEDLTDLLPDGYSVRIREWDKEDNPQ